jgi:antitoxin component of MazEF toxin-antitoxin module
VYLHVKGRPGAIGTEDALTPEELSELLAEVEGTTPEAIVEEISDD